MQQELPALVIDKLLPPDIYVDYLGNALFIDRSTPVQQNYCLPPPLHPLIGFLYSTWWWYFCAICFIYDFECIQQCENYRQHLRHMIEWLRPRQRKSHNHSKFIRNDIEFRSKLMFTLGNRMWLIRKNINNTVCLVTQWNWFRII